MYNFFLRLVYKIFLWPKGASKALTFILAAMWTLKVEREKF